MATNLTPSTIPWSAQLYPILYNFFPYLRWSRKLSKNNLKFWIKFQISFIFTSELSAIWKNTYRRWRLHFKFQVCCKWPKCNPKSIVSSWSTNTSTKTERYVLLCRCSQNRGSMLTCKCMICGRKRNPVQSHSANGNIPGPTTTLWIFEKVRDLKIFACKEYFFT